MINKPAISMLAVTLCSLLLSACTSVPEGITPIQSLDINRYLGTWYEIARLDQSFERGLDHVTATYQFRHDGHIEVINRGYNPSLKQWQTAKGKAVAVGDPHVGHLAVSFFGPFYSSYIIFELDHDNYQYAFVTGPNKSYLWLLSRTKTIDTVVKNRFIQLAQSLGFATNKLVFVQHDSRPLF